MSRPRIEPVTFRSSERTLYQLSYRGRSNYDVDGIKMHISQVKFVPEFWLKKNGIIIWNIKLDLVSEPSIWYTVSLQYA